MRKFKVLLFLVLVLFLTSCSSTETDSAEPAKQENEETVVFTGDSATVTYHGCSEQKAVSGCFYVNLQIENTSENTEEFIYLYDVYVDDVKCNTGTGIPVTVAPGKKANGAFIVFTDKALCDVAAIEFQVVIADNGTMKTVEESETVSLSPNV